MIGIPKLDDANLAGTRSAEECTLILTEGDSAKSLALAGIEIVGRDRYGVYPLGGIINSFEFTINIIFNKFNKKNLISINYTLYLFSRKIIKCEKLQIIKINGKFRNNKYNENNWFAD